MPTMPSVVIRNLPDATHRALKQRATRNGRSTEAEIRAILENVVRPAHRIKLGSQLKAIGHSVGGVNLVIDRDPAPARTISLE